MANTVPLPELPACAAVPYKVLPDKIKPAYGLAPSLAVKLCRLVKPVPSVLRANTVPLPESPPALAVPYRVLPDKLVINPAKGIAPSLTPSKLCRLVKPVPLVVTLYTVPLPSIGELPLPRAVPYRVSPDRINPARGPAPSLPPAKLCRFVKPVPSVLTANTVPKPEGPPVSAVPYRVLPDKNNPASGSAPSLLAPVLGSVAVKLCRTVKGSAVTRSAGIKPRPAISAGRRNRFLSRVPKLKPRISRMTRIMNAFRSSGSVRIGSGSSVEEPVFIHAIRGICGRPAWFLGLMCVFTVDSFAYLINR